MHWLLRPGRNWVPILHSHIALSWCSSATSAKCSAKCYWTTFILTHKIFSDFPFIHIHRFIRCYVTYEMQKISLNQIKANNLDISVFRVVPCSLAEVHRRFKGAYAPITKTASTSETAVNFCQTTRHNNPEGSHRRENLKSQLDIHISQFVPNSLSWATLSARTLFKTAVICFVSFVKAFLRHVKCGPLARTGGPRHNGKQHVSRNRRNPTGGLQRTHPAGLTECSATHMARARDLPDNVVHYVLQCSHQENILIGWFPSKYDMTPFRLS
jgi:hypothetical protein